MQCYVYKSLAKRDLYIYLDRRNDFTRLPQGLAELLGELQFVVEFELTAHRQLAKETASQVLQNLTSQGYHLQMPDTEKPVPDSAH